MAIVSVLPIVAAAVPPRILDRAILVGGHTALATLEPVPQLRFHHPL